MKQQFDAVVRALCSVENIHDAQSLIEGESIELDGVEFAFLYDDEIAAEALHLKVVFGESPLEDETAIFKELLNQNHIGYAGKGPGFCLSPASGKVLYLLRLELQEATPALLVTTMSYFGAKVKEWQKTFFLSPPAVLRRRLPFA